MKYYLGVFIVFALTSLALQSCKKEFSYDTFIKSNDDSTSLETKNTYLYKSLLLGTYDSTAFDSTTGAQYFNMDSLPVHNLYYYRLTSIYNKANATELPQYVTEFYFDSTGTIHYNFIGWYYFSAQYAGTTFGKTNNEWKFTFYTDSASWNNYSFSMYFKEFSHITLPLPPMQ